MRFKNASTAKNLLASSANLEPRNANHPFKFQTINMPIAENIRNALSEDLDSTSS